MKGTKTGSITVFMSLMLMIIASLLFTVLECSRILMLEMTAAINSQSITESMFAEYHVPAYQNYHLFIMDSGYGTGQLQLSKINQKMQELGQENLNPAVKGFGKFSNFLQMDVTDSRIVRYELATDQNAEPLLRQISQLMKKELIVDLAENTYQKITDVQESGKQGEKADKYLDGALDTIERAKEALQTEQLQAEQPFPDEQKTTGSFHMRSLRDNEGNLQSGEEYPDPGTEMENPLDTIKSAKNSPLLAQILTDGSNISTKQLAKEDSIDTRVLHTGNYDSCASSGVVDKILVMQYLKKYTSNYRNKIALPQALTYEQEYILFGKPSDEQNLKKMASKLLLIREGINFAYLLTDSAKCEEALAIAASVSAIAGIPAAVKAVQMGILASWAYAESIAELRTLFSGGKIASIKTAESWTVSLSEAAAVPFQSSIKSRQVDSGLDYEDYLQAFLALENTGKIGRRFANLLEKNLRLYAGHGQTKLDCMITAMETNHEYQAQQVFLTFVTIARLSKKGYRYEETYKFSYTDEEKNT